MSKIVDFLTVSHDKFFRADHPTHQPQDSKHQLNRLRRKVEITRDVRMRASRRCFSRHRASVYLVSTLSTGVILLSLLPNTLKEVDQNQAQVLLASSIIFSIFIIFTSVIDSMTNFYHRGRVFQRNGEELGKIFYELNFNPKAYNPDVNFVKFYSDRYEKVVNSIPYNHDYVDFLAVRIGKVHLFPRRYSKVIPIMIIQKFRDRITLYFWKISWLLPSLTAVAIVAMVVWKLVLPPGSLGAIT